MMRKAGFGSKPKNSLNAGQVVGSRAHLGDAAEVARLGIETVTRSSSSFSSPATLAASRLVASVVSLSAMTRT